VGAEVIPGMYGILVGGVLESGEFLINSKAFLSYFILVPPGVVP